LPIQSYVWQNYEQNNQQKKWKSYKKLINLLVLTDFEEKLDGKKITNNKMKNVKIMIIKF
jgi:hypothetical protein